MSFDYLGVDHIGVAIRDLAQASETYGKVLGFEVSGGEVLEDRGLRVAFVETGNSRIELIAPTRPNSEVSGFLDKRGEGIHHICLKVSDLQAAIDQMREKGARIVGDGIQDGAHGTKVAFLHPKSTGGVLIELVQA